MNLLIYRSNLLSTKYGALTIVLCFVEKQENQRKILKIKAFQVTLIFGENDLLTVESLFMHGRLYVVRVPLGRFHFGTLIVLKRLMNKFGIARKFMQQNPGLNILKLIRKVLCRNLASSIRKKYTCSQKKLLEKKKNYPWLKMFELFASFCKLLFHDFIKVSRRLPCIKISLNDFNFIKLPIKYILNLAAISRHKVLQVSSRFHSNFESSCDLKSFTASSMQTIYIRNII